jgi:hypothetical protein
MGIEQYRRREFSGRFRSATAEASHRETRPGRFRIWRPVHRERWTLVGVRTRASGPRPCTPSESTTRYGRNMAGRRASTDVVQPATMAANCSRDHPSGRILSRRLYEKNPRHVAPHRQRGGALAPLSALRRRFGSGPVARRPFVACPVARRRSGCSPVSVSPPLFLPLPAIEDPPGGRPSQSRARAGTRKAIHSP